jgi:hypothetical protein
MNAPVQAAALMPQAGVAAISASLLETIAIEHTGEVNQVGESRLGYFIKHAKSTDETTFRKALTEFKTAHKDDKTFAVRASEFQALYFAMLHGAEYSDMGYASAVSFARKHLEGKKLRTNGQPILSDEEKAANRLKNLRRKATIEAMKVVDMGQPDAMAKLQAEIDNQIAKAQDEAAASAAAKKLEKVDSLVKSIMDEGPEYASEVLSRLQAALNSSVE